ncbi:MAG: SMEK domain-containing protein [Bacteroidia bacterium]|nr:SMEK domain-containing protein [Bacteroidia bacterium]
MNRTHYFNYIEEKISALATRIKERGKLNILDLNIHAENFYAHFFNKLYDWNLINSNITRSNFEAIDLVDNNNKLIVQVSATCTKRKLEGCLMKENIQNYSKYTFKFISITKNTDKLRLKNYNNPYNITFNPQVDIIDANTILNNLLSLEISRQKDIYNFIKQELGAVENFIILDSNLANIVNMLSSERWSEDVADYKFNPYEINKKLIIMN